MDLVALLILTLVAGSTQAYQAYQTSIPNGNNVPHPCKVNFMWPGVGHLNRLGGGLRNPFGKDFPTYGSYWNEDICKADSDGDGKSNGEELGDPDCVWDGTTTPKRTANITHPGVCDPFGSPQCEGKNDFVECEHDEFKCPRIDGPDVKYIDMPFKETVVPAKETNYYCMTFDLPNDQDYHAIATTPIIDNANLLHHVVVYACKGNGTTIPTPRECGMEASDRNCDTIIALWGVGSSGFCYSDNVGIPFGKSGVNKIKLEVHYNNPRLERGEKDSSGMRFYYEPAKEGVEDLATLTTGSMTIDLPPGKPRIEVPSVCSSMCTRSLVTKPAKITGAVNHMHYLGSSMKIELFRGGSKVADITNDEFYSYDFPVQHVHDPNIDLLPGDEIKTTCVYNTMSTDGYTYFGDATSDEMCYGFIFLYPKEALRFEGCTTFGGLDICELYSGTPIMTENGWCDWGVFTHVDANYSPPWFAQAKKYCRMDGVCSDACRKFVEDLMKNPCMHEDARSLVNWRLSDVEGGLMALARINSCMGAVMTDDADHHDDDHDDGGKHTSCTWEQCQTVCPVPDSQAYDAAVQMTGGPVVALLAAACLAIFNTL